MYYFSEKDLYSPTCPAILETPSSHREASIWKRQRFGNSCAHMVLNIMYEVPAL